MRMLTVIAAKRCIHVPLLLLHSHNDCYEAMHVCVGVCVLVCTYPSMCFLLHKAYAAARQFRHVWECISVIVKAHGHCDCCEAMRAVCMLVFMPVQGAWSR
jgi:hypothetical protein